MMRLMVATLHHNPYKAERFKFGEWLHFVRRDRQLYAIWYLIGLCVPADFAQLVHVCWNHTLNRFNGATFACHGELDPTVKHTRRSSSVKGDLVHIDQMLP